MGTRGRPPIAFTLSEDERVELTRRLRAETTSRRDVRRARVILECTEGGATGEIARRAGVSPKTVERWRGRFARDGLKGLVDDERSGRPSSIRPVQRFQIIAAACAPVPPRSDGVTAWTLDLLRESILDLGIVERLSRSGLHRLLDACDLKPFHVRGWLHSTDLNFRAKATEVCELYLNPPRDAIVLSIDEKTGMQALERKYRDRPSAPGDVARREFEYVRHGTQTLIASFEVATGRVLATCGRTRKADDLVRFMHEVAAAYPARQVHIVWDNLNIHHGERWRAFNAEHGGRFHFHYTPIHASWVNQIELWFAILQRRSLKRGSFTTEEELRDTVLAFIRAWNENAHPFRWTFTGYPLQAGRSHAEAA